MAKFVYLITGFAALALGGLGVALPPTVPFLILAAFCFVRSNEALERRLLDHPVFGPRIRLWRELDLDATGGESRPERVRTSLPFKPNNRTR